MSESYDVIVIFSICGYFRAIWKPDSGRIVYKTYISIILSYKTRKRNKTLIFCQENSDISKIKRVLVLKDKFSKTTYVCVFTYQICTKFLA